MRSFADLDPLVGAVPAAIVARLSTVDAGRGSGALYADQLPGLLKELADAARVESVIASSAIEGIVVEQGRAERIVRGAAQRLRVRSEKELAGYRDALDYLFRDDPGDLPAGLVLHLRRLLLGRTGGGRESSRLSKTSSWNVMSTGRRVSGSPRSRTGPLLSTRPSLSIVTAPRLEPRNTNGALLAGLFALDFLTIHPFVDGNGRLSRLLSTRLLSETGYRIGRFVSLEGLVYRRRDA